MIDPVFPIKDHDRTGLSTTIPFVDKIMNANTLCCQPKLQSPSLSLANLNECKKTILDFYMHDPFNS
jgi:hypothetical protein